MYQFSCSRSLRNVFFCFKQIQIDNLKSKLAKVKNVFNAPGNILNAGCNGIKSAISAVGRGFKSAGSKIKKAFSSIKNFLGKRRRKRSDGCGIKG